jgi:predicted NAD/FAD-binding protein
MVCLALSLFSQRRWRVNNQIKGAQRIAVIGGGISGLAAAYLFQQEHEVHLFEAEGRLGGHANTVLAGRDNAAVDTGFIVFNELNYPNLTNLFRHLGVDVADSEMTLSVKFKKPDFEWGGTSIATLIAQKRNLLRPKFWRMVRDILRFHREAAQNLQLASHGRWTLGDLLKKQNYSRAFIDWYLIPMGAAIWSTPTDIMFEFPAETFLQFCMNHRLLQVDDRPMWKTVRGGSQSYVKKLAARLKNIHSGYSVDQVIRKASGGADLITRGEKLHFDHVIFATHPPQTLKILADLSDEEREILESFSFQKNIAQLHSDVSFMPKRKSLWSAWNFHQQNDASSMSPVSLSYWMNRLQPLTTRQEMILSLNAVDTPRDLHHRIEYEHPLFNQRAIAAQRNLADIQGKGGVYHCGAWTRYGFHEDGILSAVNLARAWELPIPWMHGSSRPLQTHALAAQGA